VYALCYGVQMVACWTLIFSAMQAIAVGWCEATVMMGNTRLGHKLRASLWCTSLELSTCFIKRLLLAHSTVAPLCSQQQ
jgi:hypothetical protein